MPYVSREPTTTVVITIKTKDIKEIRDWLRLEVLADPGYESVKELLFELYQRIGEVR